VQEFGVQGLGCRGRVQGFRVSCLDPGFEFKGVEFRVFRFRV